MQIAVIDLRLGNLRSVQHALMTVAPEAQIVITQDQADVENSDKVVLPGQGAIGPWFLELEKESNGKSMKQALLNAIDDKPVLGICVGMQALFSYCEEGNQAGLQLFDGSVRHFKHFHSANSQLKIPQMGWNQVTQVAEHPLWQNIESGSHFYFVHSYCANMSDDSEQSGVHSVVQGTADYGHSFVAAVARSNVFAVQFHPEKSHRDGLQLLKNFTDWRGE